MLKTPESATTHDVHSKPSVSPFIPPQAGPPVPIHDSLLLSDQNVSTSSSLRALARELSQNASDSAVNNKPVGAQAEKNWNTGNSRTEESQKNFFQAIKDLYLKPNFLEKNGTIYRLLGVHHFKRLLMNTIGRITWHSVGNQDGLRQGELRGWSNYRMNQDVRGMKEFIKASYFNEFVHTIGAIPVGLKLAALAFGTGASAGLGTALLFGINAYCVFLQRYNRARIYPVMERLEAREQRRRDNWQSEF